MYFRGEFSEAADGLRLGSVVFLYDSRLPISHPITQSSWSVTRISANIHEGLGFEDVKGSFS